jgi:rubredoxin
MAIEASGMTVDFGFARRPFQYLPELGPPTLYAICKGHLQSLPVRFLLQTDAIGRIRIGRGSSPRWIWLFSEPARILLFSREARTEEQPAEPPALQRWVAADRVFAIFDQPIPCARCGALATRFRALPDSLICSTCGRSSPTDHATTGVHFETAH